MGSSPTGRAMRKIIILVIILILGVLTFIYLKPVSNDISVDSDNPFVTEISPTSAKIGTEVVIEGRKFSGFEGDKYAWIENTKTGLKGIIYNDAGSTDNIIRFTLKDKYCTTDTSYSGSSCPSYLNIIPGVYDVYVIPWGKKSNTVKLTVTGL